MEIDLKQLRELMRSLKQFDVHEIEIEKDGERVYLRRGPEHGAAPTMIAPVAMPAMASVAPPPPAAPSAPAPAAAAGAASDPNVVAITSPFVGTFYRAPSPGAPPFVEVGDAVVPGQTLCILEAMKLMNEVKADREALVRRVCVENAEPVEYGQLLFELEPLNGAPLDAL